MRLSELPKTTKRPKKRVGRGYSSGKGGHTVGKGQKGQKVRGKTKKFPPPVRKKGFKSRTQRGAPRHSELGSESGS